MMITYWVVVLLLHAGDAPVGPPRCSIVKLVFVFTICSCRDQRSKHDDLVVVTVVLFVLFFLGYYCFFFVFVTL